MTRLVAILVAVVVAGSFLFLVPTADARRSCLSTALQDQCLLECIPNSQKMCADDPNPSLCAQDLSNLITIAARQKAEECPAPG